MPDEHLFHQGHTGFVAVGFDMAHPGAEPTVKTGHGESDLQGVFAAYLQEGACREYRDSLLGKHRGEETSLPDLPPHVASVLLETYAGMRESAKRARAHYYHLDEQVTQAEQDWMDAREQAKEMETFLRRSGVPVDPVEG